MSSRTLSPLALRLLPGVWPNQGLELTDIQHYHHRDESEKCFGLAISISLTRSTPHSRGQGAVDCSYHLFQNRYLRTEPVSGAF